MWFCGPSSSALRLISMIAAFMGVSSGIVLERRFVQFSSCGILWKRISRYLLGVGILLGLWGGLRITFSAMEPVAIFRFARYYLVGLWGGFGGPWLFVHLKLADSEWRMTGDGLRVAGYGFRTQRARR